MHKYKYVDIAQLSPAEAEEGPDMFEFYLARA